MTAYVDSLRPCLRNKSWRYDSSCHLMADTELELLDFGGRIGMMPEWIQRGRLLHFDLTPNKRVEAVAAGAIEVDNKFVADMMRRHRGGAE